MNLAILTRLTNQENISSSDFKLETSYIGNMARLFKCKNSLLTFLALGILLLIVFYILAALFFVKTPPQIKYGVTFSPRYARYLGLDWRQTFVKILNETGAKNLRLPTYWEEIEVEPNNFNFSDSDFMLLEAGQKGAKVIMVVGARQPRWPECHVPAWAKALSVTERRQKILQFVAKTVERYKDHSSVWAWQVENEPLLKSFGESCDSPDKNFLKTEAGLVKSLSNKTVIMTDSGELGSWVTAMRLSDIFGTTLYRQVYDKFFGYTTYPLPPYFYNIKSSLVRNIFAPNNLKTIIVELQAEPWFANGDFVATEEQIKLFTTQDFKNYTNFARGTGFDEVYLWGVEWWYFMAGQGHPEYLEYAKTLFK